MMKDSEDSILWQQFLTGNKEAFAQLFLTYHPLLLHYGIRLCRNEHLAEEHIQDLFCDLFDARENLTQVKHLKAYLFVAYRRRILQKSRSRELLKQPVDLESDISFSQEELIIREENLSDQSKILYTLLNDLPGRQKEIIYLKYFNGLTNKEIAKILDINHQSVLNSLYKAFKRLRKTAKEKRMSPFFLWML